MRKVITWVLKNIDFFIASIALAGIVILTFLGVIFRYVLSSPIVWLEEVQMLLIVWCVFIAAGGCFRTNNHVSVDIITERLPEKIRWITAWIIFIATIAVITFLGIRGFQLVLQLYATKRKTNILKIPYFIIYCAVPIGSLNMIINFIVQTIKKGELRLNNKHSQKGEHD